jgi:hypothetical protein
VKVFKAFMGIPMGLSDFDPEEYYCYKYAVRNIRCSTPILIQDLQLLQ